MRANLPIFQELGDDLDLIRELARQYVEYSTQQVEAIHKAIVSKDAKSVRDGAHQLKGASGYFSEGDLRDNLQLLESFGAEARFDDASRIMTRVEALLTQVKSDLSELFTPGSR